VGTHSRSTTRIRLDLPTCLPAYLHLDTVTAETLVALIGVYGDVVKVKILAHKDAAMVQVGR
jgi:hypothetical protein